MSARRLGVLALLVLLPSACGEDVEARHGVLPLELPDASEQEARTLLRDARAILEDGDERAAIGLLDRVLELTPDEPEAHYLKGLARFERDEFALAIDPLQRSLELRPEDVRPRARLAEALFVVGRYDESRDIYRTWVQEMQNNVDARVGLARVQYHTGRYKAAVKHLTKAVKLKGRSAAIRSDLGLAHRALGQYAEAEARQREAIDADAGYVEAWFRLADAISAQGPERYPEALERLEKTIELDPSHFLARVYAYRLHRYLAADGATGDDIDAAWASVLAGFARGRKRHRGLDPVEEELREDVETEAELRRAIVDAPGEAGTHRRLAVYLHRLGRADQALPEYEAALLSWKDDAATHAAHGAALIEARRPVEARAALERAAELDPRLPAAWTNLGYLHLGEGRDADATAAYANALALRPGDRRSRVGLGLAWMHGDRLEEGLAEILAAGG